MLIISFIIFTGLSSVLNDFFRGDCTVTVSIALHYEFLVSPAQAARVVSVIGLRCR